MDPVPTERRLAAILAADVVGYSRLMGADEIGTLRALKSLRRDLLDPAISGHRGRIVKTTGDGLLVEFASVVDAVVCAAAIQHDLASWPALGRTEDRLTLRIGVNIGDIIIDGADIFGDGVNLASRLEAICEPGGVTFSRAVHEQVRDKLAFPFTDLGEHNVKNIARPVQVFGIGADAIGAMGRPVLPGQVVGRSAPAKRAPSEASEQKTRDRGKAGSWRAAFRAHRHPRLAAVPAWRPAPRGRRPHRLGEAGARVDRFDDDAEAPRAAAARNFRADTSGPGGRRARDRSADQAASARLSEATAIVPARDAPARGNRSRAPHFRSKKTAECEWLFTSHH